MRTVQRSRSRYGSARAAWSAIAETTGLEPRDVEAAHTDRAWRWKVRGSAPSSGSANRRRRSNPLRHGYSRRTIAANIRELVEQGYSQDRAAAAAYREAREAWRDRHGRAPYPEHLQRRRRRRRNPVGRHQHYAQAVRLYRDYHGEDPQFVDEYLVPSTDVAVYVGRVTGIMYEARREGELVEWIHEFSGRSRPVFAVSPDGEQILVLGGEFRFTERGIVDGV